MTAGYPVPSRYPPGIRLCIAGESCSIICFSHHLSDHQQVARMCGRADGRVPVVVVENVPTPRDDAMMQIDRRWWTGIEGCGAAREQSRTRQRSCRMAVGRHARRMTTSAPSPAFVLSFSRYLVVARKQQLSSSRSAAAVFAAASLGACVCGGILLSLLLLGRVRPCKEILHEQKDKTQKTPTTKKTLKLFSSPSPSRVACSFPLLVAGDFNQQQGQQFSKQQK